MCILNCFGSDTSRIENGIYTPFYDALLFNDIAEILNELDNSGHSPLEALINSESESDENVDDLLSEYQHFLEKAHKQRKTFLEKNKPKNKVPLYRHETYVKNKPDTYKYDDHYPNNMRKSGIIKLPRSYYKSPFNNSPFEFLIPLNSKNEQNPEILSEPSYKNPKINQDVGLIQLESHQVRGDFAPLFPSEYSTGNQYENRNYFTPEQKSLQQIVPFTDQSEKVTHDNENAVNIHIKVDIQAPKFLGAAGSHHCRNHTHSKSWDGNDLESAPSTLTLPFPYYNFPMPMEMLSFKAPKNNKPEGAQYHKIMIHKKKKGRSSGSSKKHRKKLMSFHDVKFDPRQQTSTILVQTFAGSNFNNPNITNTTEENPVNVSQRMDKQKEINIERNKTVSATTELIKTTEISDDDVIYLTKDHENSITATEENAKNENSIEVDESKSNSSGVTEGTKNLRKRRDISVNDANSTTNAGKSNPKVEELKKVDRFSFSDPELVNWPNTNASKHQSADKNNLTALILERENKKAKLDISHESIRLNYRTALQKAIFGDVNWDDVDTVAPVFISFVGKYITGVLTFCSPTICHSMKCAQKECVHRVCAPNERLHSIGHCEGSNSTDSVASMESIMDLPSNVAFEIVDILQENMQGKMFGKVTLCISPKCITFASAKKSFLKHKCSIKDLSSSGHCQTVKNIKSP